MPLGRKCNVARGKPLSIDVDRENVPYDKPDDRNLTSYYADDPEVIAAFTEYEQPMTPTDLLALISWLEGLAEKATPGPWNLVTHHRQGHDRLVPVWYVKAENDVGIAVQPAFSAPEHEEANAELITAIPTTIKTLCAELRQRIEREQTTLQFPIGTRVRKIKGYKFAGRVNGTFKYFDKPEDTPPMVNVQHDDGWVMHFRENELEEDTTP